MRGYVCKAHTVRTLHPHKPGTHIRRHPQSRHGPDTHDTHGSPLRHTARAHGGCRRHSRYAAAATITCASQPPPLEVPPAHAAHDAAVAAVGWCLLAAQRSTPPPPPLKPIRCGPQPRPPRELAEQEAKRATTHARTHAPGCALVPCRTRLSRERLKTRTRSRTRRQSWASRPRASWTPPS